MVKLVVDKSFLVEDFNYPEKEKNYKPKTENKYLVLHNIVMTDITKIIEVFKRFRASCHYVVDEKGKIYQLVDESKVAYHCGYSYWNGDLNLNQKSIGVEFINSDPYGKKFSKVQLDVGIELCKDVIERHGIESQNVVGHSDIAYFSDDEPYRSFGINGWLNRKQDPSHMFDWGYLVKNGVGFWYDGSKIDLSDFSIEFFLGDKNSGIRDIQKKLQKIGYKVNVTGYFDLEFKNLAMVFCRRFIPSGLVFVEEGQWLGIFTEILNEIVRSF